MALKSVVLSIKHGNKVVSWDGERRTATEFMALPRSFFDAPEKSELFTSRARKLNHPVLGEVIRTTAAPGACGWIGMDTDKRQVIDIQGFQDLNSWHGRLYRNEPFSLPAALKEMCESGPWSYRVEGKGGIDETLGPVLLTDKAWNKWLTSVKEKLPNDSYSLSIAVPFHESWQWIDAGIGRRAEEQNRGIGRAFEYLVRGGWEPHLAKKRSKWEEFLIEYCSLTPDAVYGWSNHRRALQLAKSLPEPLVSSHPKPRF